MLSILLLLVVVVVVVDTWVEVEELVD